jgi:hypothetical protein
MRKSNSKLETVTTVGLDLAKNVMQVHAVDAAGNVVVNKPIRRGKLGVRVFRGFRDGGFRGRHIKSPFLCDLLRAVLAFGPRLPGLTVRPSLVSTAAMNATPPSGRPLARGVSKAALRSKSSPGRPMRSAKLATL